MKVSAVRGQGLAAIGKCLKSPHNALDGGLDWLAERLAEFNILGLDTQYGTMTCVHHLQHVQEGQWRRTVRAGPLIGNFVCCDEVYRSGWAAEIQRVDENDRSRFLLDYFQQEAVGDSLRREDAPRHGSGQFASYHHAGPVVSAQIVAYTNNCKRLLNELGEMFYEVLGRFDPDISGTAPMPARRVVQVGIGVSG